MTHKKVYVPKRVLFTLFTSGTFYCLFAQKNINISAGLSLPELINLGAQYQFEKSQLGLSIGTADWGNGFHYKTLPGIGVAVFYRLKVSSS